MQRIQHCNQVIFLKCDAQNSLGFPNKNNRRVLQMAIPQKEDQLWTPGVITDKSVHQWVAYT